MPSSCPVRGAAGSPPPVVAVASPSTATTARHPQKGQTMPEDEHAIIGRMTTFGAEADQGPGEGAGGAQNASTQGDPPHAASPDGETR